MKCKNVNCSNEAIEKRLYCSLSCRNEYVNKHLRNYDKCSKIFKQKREKMEEEYLKSPKYCKKCKDIIPFNKKNDNKTFCSRSCSASYNNMNRGAISRDKIRSGIKKYIEKNGYFGAILIKINSRKNNKRGSCLNCNKDLLNNKFYCNRKCMNAYKRKDMDNFTKYKLDCQFKFNLADFPNEYDFSLVEEYGWYSPTNKKNNLLGVSRDHIFSIREGYDFDIDPKIISHPANCQLLKHSKNISKNKKSSISLEELLTRIENFNKKYNYSQ